MVNLFVLFQLGERGMVMTITELLVQRAMFSTFMHSMEVWFVVATYCKG